MSREAFPRRGVSATPPYAEYYCPDCGWAFSAHERDDDGRKLCPEDA